MDLDAIRNDLPDIGELIHFNNAGSSLMPRPVYEAYMDFQDEEWKKGGYETMAARQEELATFYTHAAEMLGCSSEEVAFTDSATTAWQRAFFSLPWKEGDEIITANTEYASNYISYLRLRKIYGIVIRVARDDARGIVDVDHLRSLISRRTALIAVTHMPTISGIVDPVEEIGKVAREHGVTYLVDACQSVGHYPLDVNRIGCDILSGTGRKYLRGPRGTGLLYVRKEMIETMDPISIDLYSGRWLSGTDYQMRNNAVRFETFEANLAAKAGLARAMEYYNKLGAQNVWQRIQALAAELRASMNSVPGVKVHDRGPVLSGICTFTVKGISCAEVSAYLHEQGINVSFGTILNSRLYMEANDLEEVVRASVHYFNTSEEIERFSEVLTNLKD